MRQEKNSFRHESLQDAKTIQDLLKAITKGLARGRLSFSDDDGDIVLEPEGLLKIKVTASQDSHQERLDIRISWQTDDSQLATKTLKIEG
ncbi:MAG: amphi-Trp domain-containing protein [Zhongshania sp.]|uniref:amphi-Trp domain-containing protein n=1 Tax=Zhongshania sp. TaxID=1971902 RepID=UPI00263443E5|nr:amphi-Trp domain-containing protein [Zhongshania sp.]MDF1692490.1 amphi-Trp domain-containing protein [Zhongshania sp.]